MLNLVESLGRNYFRETHNGSCFKHEDKFWFLHDVTTAQRLVCSSIEDVEGDKTYFPADILQNNKPFWETPLGLRAISCSQPGIGKRLSFLKGAYGLEKTIQPAKILTDLSRKSLTELLIPQYCIFKEVLEAMLADKNEDFQAVLDKTTAFSYTAKTQTGRLTLYTGEKAVKVATISKEGDILNGNETLAFSLINRDRYEPK